MSLVSQRIGFNAAANAIGASQKTLCNWLERNQVTISEQSKGRREFTLLDIATLSLVRRLVAFGMRVREANQHATAIIVGSRLVPLLKDETPETLVAAWRDSSVTVWRGEQGWIYRISPSDDTDAPRHTNGNRVNAVLTLDVASILAIAFDRAAKALTPARSA